MFDKLLKILTFTSITLIFLPVISFAQMNADIPFALSSELGVKIVPDYPRPNEMVDISLTLYTGDLNSANITWYQDGKKVLSGKGETKYSFKAGSIGIETQLKITIALLNGSSFSKVITLNPASVDLAWEADSYVPPFYSGKALHSRQGILKIVAMPEFIKDGKRISPQNLVYKWSNGINVYQSKSGYGKNVLTLNGSILGKNEDIEVLVTDPTSNLTAQGFINIAPVDPEIVFYQNDPYYGFIFDSAIKSPFSLKTDEIQIFATPYYFTKENGDLLKYDWQLNSQTIPNLADSRTAVFRKPEDKKDGQSVISLQMENTNRILQQASASLIMNINK